MTPMQSDEEADDEPYFQCSMASKGLAGLMSRADFLTNLRKVFQRLQDHNVAANPRKTKLGLTQVEYVGHLISY